jgi:hypothetical protein
VIVRRYKISDLGTVWLIWISLQASIMVGRKTIVTILRIIAG